MFDLTLFCFDHNEILFLAPDVKTERPGARLILSSPTVGRFGSACRSLSRPCHWQVTPERGGGLDLILERYRAIGGATLDM